MKLKSTSFVNIKIPSEYEIARKVWKEENYDFSLLSLNISIGKIFEKNIGLMDEFFTFFSSQFKNNTIEFLHPTKSIVYMEKFLSCINKKNLVLSEHDNHQLLNNLNSFCISKTKGFSMESFPEIKKFLGQINEEVIFMKAPHAGCIFALNETPEKRSEILNRNFKTIVSHISSFGISDDNLGNLLFKLKNFSMDAENKQIILNSFGKHKSLLNLDTMTNLNWDDWCNFIAEFKFYLSSGNVERKDGFVFFEKKHANLLHNIKKMFPSETLPNKDVNESNIQVLDFFGCENQIIKIQFLKKENIDYLIEKRLLNLATKVVDNLGGIKAFEQNDDFPFKKISLLMYIKCGGDFKDVRFKDLLMKIDSGNMLSEPVVYNELAKIVSENLDKINLTPLDKMQTLTKSRIFTFSALDFSDLGEYNNTLVKCIETHISKLNKTKLKQVLSTALLEPVQAERIIEVIEKSEYSEDRKEELRVIIEKKLMVQENTNKAKLKFL